jgi:Lipase (class 3)
LLCGHSLGAGVASLLAILLRSRFPWLQQNESLHVYSFACPPVLDFDAAIACAPFCTTIVNNSDVIPRSSLANLRSLVYLLNSVHGAMEEQGLSPIGPSSVMALLRHLSQGTHGDLLMTEDLVNEAMDAAQDRVGLRDSEHLYIPGRVILMYEKWDEANAGEDKSYMQGDTIAAAAAAAAAATEPISKKDGNEVHVKSPTLVHACLTNGTAKPLRFIEIDGGRMVTDHTTVSYYNSVNELALRYQSGV